MAYRQQHTRTRRIHVFRFIHTYKYTNIHLCMYVCALRDDAAYTAKRSRGEKASRQSSDHSGTHAHMHTHTYIHTYIQTCILTYTNNRLQTRSFDLRKWTWQSWNGYVSDKLVHRLVTLSMLIAVAMVVLVIMR